MNIESGDDHYLTLEEAAELLRKLNIKVSASKMRYYATDRKLPFFRFGKFLYISEKELLATFRALQKEASTRNKPTQ